MSGFLLLHDSPPPQKQIIPRLPLNDLLFVAQQTCWQ